MAKPFLPIAPEDGDESGRPDVYLQRMDTFERLFDFKTSKMIKKRRPFSDYTKRNCEEAYGERP